MATTKITDLTAYTDPISTDVVPIVDVTSDVTKKVSIADLMENAGSGSEGAPGISFDGDPNTGIYRPGADQVAISTGGTGRLFVDASGRVGIGTTSPNRRLEVSDATVDNFIRVNTTGATKSGIEFASGGTVYSQLYFNNVSPYDLSLLQQYSTGSVILGTNNTERARIDSLGRLLVGTSSATNSAPLQVLASDSGAWAAQLRMRDSSNDYCYVNFSDNTGSESIANIWSQRTAASTGILAFETNDGSANPTERMRIDSSGNVGIGTTTPIALFHATPPDAAGASSTDGVRVSAGTSSVGINIGANSSATFGWIQSSEAGVAFAPTVINPQGGNVGIGTTSVGAKLHVATAGNNYIVSHNTTGSTSALLLGAESGSTSLYSWTTVSGSTGVPLKFFTGATEAMRLDTSGRLLVGTSTARTMGTTIVPSLQAEGTSNNTSALALVQNNSNATIGASVTLAKTRATGNGGTTVVQSGENLGSIYFEGADGTNLVSAARISAAVDGTPGANDMPGRLVFSTTADGASSPTERMRIDSNGWLYSLPTYNKTAGAAANVGVNAGDGVFFRSTSSIKYKRDVVDYDKGLQEVLQLRPVYYKGKSEFDGDTQFAGLIAEEIDELGLKEFVQYAEDGSPDALAYGHMVSLLTKAIQQQQTMIAELQAEVAALKGA